MQRNEPETAREVFYMPQISHSHEQGRHAELGDVAALNKLRLEVCTLHETAW